MTDIRIKINDEDELFNPFNPEDEFSDEVKGFITAQLESLEHPDSITFTFISPVPLDRERVELARIRWNNDLQESIKREKKVNRFKQLWFLTVGAVFIIVDLLLADYFNTIIEVALSTFGAFCLEEVAYIWIVDYPRLRLLKTILRVLAKTETVRYEQPQD